MEEKKRKPKLAYIAREKMTQLIDDANEMGIAPKDIIQIVVKGNTFNLVYSK